VKKVVPINEISAEERICRKSQFCVLIVQNTTSTLYTNAHVYF